MEVKPSEIKENDIITVFYKDYDRTLQKLFKVKVVEVKKDYFLLEQEPTKYPFPMVHAVYKKNIIMLNKICG